MKLLIADDNTEFRSGICRLLAQEGFTIMEASDGLIASEMAFDENPDIILCDFVMPRMNGLTLYFLLKKNEQTRHIPFILMSASIRITELQHWQREALSEIKFLTKPFTLEALIQTLHMNNPYQAESMTSQVKAPENGLETNWSLEN